MTLIKNKVEKVEIRVNMDQKKKIKELAAKKGMTVSKYVLYRLNLDKLD